MKSAQQIHYNHTIGIFNNSSYNATNANHINNHIINTNNNNNANNNNNNNIDDDGYSSVHQLNRAIYDTSVMSRSNDTLSSADTDDIEILYKAMYKQAKLPKFVSFDYIDINSGEDGIPKRAAIFYGNDFVNSIADMGKFTGKLRSATFNDYYHIIPYMRSPDFTSDIFKTQYYDAILNAIVSFLLELTDDSLQTLYLQYEVNQKFIERLQQFRNLDNGAYVYSFYGKAVCKCAIKLLKLCFNDTDNNLNNDISVDDVSIAARTGLIRYNNTTAANNNNDDDNRIFIWTNHINSQMIVHFRNVERNIYENILGINDLRADFESHQPIPYTLPNITDDLETIRSTGPIKFITGVACCGKTTILSELTKCNWKIYSRSDVGSYSGKANNPSSIGALYAAQDYVLSQSDVIGDRCIIDNIIWYFIMEYLNPKYQGDVVTKFLEFLNSEFNEPAIATFIQQRGVIFIDTNFQANKVRMMNRNTDGDAHRSRLNYYAIVQFICYYICGRLFGWKIVCVPYDKQYNYEPKQYQKICKDLHRHFLGETIINNIVDDIDIMSLHPKSSTLNCSKFPKPLNDYMSDMTFAKAVGIYK